MVKQIQLFITFLLFTACVSLQANTTPTEPVGNPVTQNPLDDICALASPTTVTVVATGPNWAKLIWTSVPGAAQYHVITRDAFTNAVYNDTYAPPAANSGFTVSPLPPGSYCITEVRSVCANGEEVVPGTKSIIYGLIVLDIVTVGYIGVPEGSVLDCEIQYSPAGCSLPIDGSTHYFRVAHESNGSFRNFAAYKDPSANKLNLAPNPTGNLAFQFYDDNRGKVTIFYVAGGSSTCIAQLQSVTSVNSNNVILERVDTSFNDTDYKINAYVPSPPIVDGDSDTRDNRLVITPETPLSAAPNPFTNLLDVKIPFGAEENDILISLYDLEGRQVLSVQSPGGPQIRSLSTDDLLPGLYLLQVKTGDRIETIKVVKTQ